MLPDCPAGSQTILGQENDSMRLRSGEGAARRRLGVPCGNKIIVSGFSKTKASFPLEKRVLFGSLFQNNITLHFYLKAGLKKKRTSSEEGRNIMQYSSPTKPLYFSSFWGASFRSSWSTQVILSRGGIRNLKLVPKSSYFSFWVVDKRLKNN